MAKDPQVLDFTLPARDFGHLYTTLNTLESHFAGVTVAALERLACWHVIDRCRMACCRCGIPVKWLLQEPETPEAKSNAALLLRLRQFFAALGPDDQPDEYWTSGEKPDPTESMHVRVILRPVLQLEVKKPAAPRLTDQQKSVVADAIRQAAIDIKAHVPTIACPIRWDHCTEADEVDDPDDYACEGCAGYGPDCNAVWRDADGRFFQAALFREDPRKVAGGTGIRVTEDACGPKIERDEPKPITRQQFFGETSRPDLYPIAPDPNPLVGDLEAGCMCVAERRRASSIADLARLAGSVHPLCPIHGKDAGKRVGLNELVYGLPTGPLPTEATDWPKGEIVVLDEDLTDPIIVQRALKAGEFVQQLGGQIIEIDEAPGADYTAIVEWKPTHIADTCPKCLCPKAICVCKPAGYLLSCPDIPMISVTEAEKRAMDAIIDAAVDPAATEADLAKAFDDADRIIAELAQPPVDPRVGQLIEQARATAQRLDGDQSSPLFATEAKALEAGMCGIPAPQPEQFCRGCVKPLSNCDCGPTPDQLPTTSDLADWET